MLFLHGGGHGAYEADALLAASLQNALGSAYDVRYPKMPDEESSGYADWKAQLATELSSIPRIFLYHSCDDEVVPFAHLALYAAKLPQATIRVSDGRGHQFGNDLADVAGDISSTLSIS